MKSYGTQQGSLPQGVQVKKEGTVMRLFFDFEAVENNGSDIPGHKSEEMPPQYVCENVDVRGGNSYSDIVNAIVVDRYPSDRKDAILLNYEMTKDATSELEPEKRQEYIDEYQALQAWRKRAKEVATEVLCGA